MQFDCSTGQVSFFFHSLLFSFWWLRYSSFSCFRTVCDEVFGCWNALNDSIWFCSYEWRVSHALCTTAYKIPFHFGAFCKHVFTNHSQSVKLANNSFFDFAQSPEFHRGTFCYKCSCTQNVAECCELIC